MKVFLSWSGDTSHKFARALRDWLPSVIQSIVPYVSSEDIDKGARWYADISKELEDSSYGIICLTNDNINAPWLNFEAGAISKTVDKSNVAPILFNLKRSDIKEGGPLLQFQSTIVEKQDILKLLKSINNCNKQDQLKDDKLAEAFEVWWPKLDEALTEIRQHAEDMNHLVSKPNDEVSEKDILEELLELVRSQQRIINNPEALLPQEYFQSIMQKIAEAPNPWQIRSPDVVRPLPDETVLKQDDRVNRLTSVIEANQLRNDWLLTEFLDIGIRKLDENAKKRFDNVIHEQEKLAATELGSIATLKLLVKAYLEMGNYDKAILGQKNIVSKEENIQNYYDLALIYHSRGMFNYEQDTAKEMLRLDENNPIAYGVLGSVSVMLASSTMDSTPRKMYDDEALRCFRKARELDGKYVLPKMGEALILARRNLTIEALEIIKNVEEMGQKEMLSAKDYYGLACFYVVAGNHELALRTLAASFEKAAPSTLAQLLATAQIDPDLKPLKNLNEFQDIKTRYSN